MAFWWKLLSLVAVKQFTCQEFEFDGNHFFVTFLPATVDIEQKISFSWCKTFSRIFEAASYVSRGAMALEKHFVLELFLLSSDIHIKYFSLLVETSKHCCRKQIYVSRVWVWRKPFFCYFSASNCWYWAKNLIFLV